MNREVPRILGGFGGPEIVVDEYAPEGMVPVKALIRASTDGQTLRPVNPSYYIPVVEAIERELSGPEKMLIAEKLHSRR